MRIDNYWKFRFHEKIKKKRKKRERITAQLLDASAYPIVVSPGDTIYVRARLQAWRGDIFYKELTFTVPKDQLFGEMILEVRGGGVVPLPYLIQQQKYNLTDEIINRLHVYKDFEELHTKLLKEDQNNQIVVEIIDPEVSMVSKDKNEGTKAEIQNKAADKDPAYLKGKEETGEKDKEKEAPKSKIDTDYVIYGDGQFTFKVMAPKDRDAALKKLAKIDKKLSVEMSTKEKETEKSDDSKQDSGNKPDSEADKKEKIEKN